MSSIKLQKVCLDYVVKTGSDSIKKTAFHLLNKCFKRANATKPVMHNTTYRALNHIDLEINKGDRIGILGRNGAGKSTLLRVLAKVYKPSQGQIDIQGNISTVFDVHLGMNVEATGYENIVNLSIMRGISKKSAYAMIEDIEIFAELGDFLNHPVRTYSAGMQMKLAFAVATSRCSDILLIDEIIGAGDTHFMRKATKRLEKSIVSSHILVLASHDNDTVKQFCNKALVLNQGEIRFFGDIDEGVRFYESISPQKMPNNINDSFR